MLAPRKHGFCWCKRGKEFRVIVTIKGISRSAGTVLYLWLQVVVWYMRRTTVRDLQGGKILAGLQMNAKQKQRRPHKLQWLPLKRYGPYLNRKAGAMLQST